MARPPRNSLSGATYHVMLRGNNAQPIFLSDSERCRLCLFLQKGVERFGYRVLAFCFMTNHIHLAIQLGNVPLPDVIHNLACRYARFFNDKHQRTGHVFQGRFRSVLVDTRSYIKALIRYIHLNPVKAGIVARPEHYRWSSHRAYLSLDEYAWLSPRLVLDNFGRDRTTEVKAFHDFVLAGIGAEEETLFESGGPMAILGDDAFISEVTDRGSRAADCPELDVDLETLLSVVAHHFGTEPSELQTPGRKAENVHVRAVTALFARDIERIPLREVAAFFGRDPSVMSKAIARLEGKLSRSRDLQHEINLLSHKLSTAATSS